MLKQTENHFRKYPTMPNNCENEKCPFWCITCEEHCGCPEPRSEKWIAEYCENQPETTQLINPNTGEIIEIKQIEKFQHKPMQGWYRVFEEDGSTIAYVPDVVTARIISASFAMLSFFQLIAEMPDDKIMSQEFKERIKTIVCRALDEK